MRSKRIHILSGPIQSGKTSRLIQWSKRRNDVRGILTPVIDGKRVFMDVKTGQTFRMEAEGGEPSLSVGKFVFSQSAFTRAKKILSEALKENSGWVIVDEIGPLELRGEGFYDMVIEIIKSNNTEMKFIWVIRDSLREKVIQFFEVEEMVPFEFPL